MINGETRIRVENKTEQTWVVSLLNGSALVIDPGNMQVMTVNDAIYVDNLCHDKKAFSGKYLTMTDQTGKVIEPEDIGLFGSVKTFMPKEEIISALKGSVKKVEAWIADIDDLAELDMIYNVAKDIDLPLAKVKILRKKMPNRDWLDEMQAEDEKE